MDFLRRQRNVFSGGNHGWRYVGHIKRELPDAANSVSWYSGNLEVPRWSVTSWKRYNTYSACRAVFVDDGR